PAGHPRPPHPSNARPRAGARAYDRARHRAPVRGRAAGRARLALSGAPSPRGSRLDRVVLGHLREQPARAVLPPDAEGTAATGAADDPLGRNRPRHQPHPATCGLVTVMSWRRFLRRRYWDDERRLELESYLDTEID